MLQNQAAVVTTVDAGTAEKALSLAIRLQQEQGERVSIEELHRTADEAGIDRVSLERALDQLTNQSSLVRTEHQRKPTRAAALVVMFAVVVTLIAAALPHDSQLANLLKTIGGLGFAAACLLFVRFLYRQGRL